MSLIKKVLNSGEAVLANKSREAGREYADKISGAIHTLRNLEILISKTQTSPVAKLMSHNTIVTMEHKLGIGTIRFVCDEHGPLSAEILDEQPDY